MEASEKKRANDSKGQMDACKSLLSRYLKCISKFIHNPKGRLINELKACEMYARTRLHIKFQCERRSYECVWKASQLISKKNKQKGKLIHWQKGEWKVCEEMSWLWVCTSTCGLRAPVKRKVAIFCLPCLFWNYDVTGSGMSFSSLICTVGVWP